MGAFCYHFPSLPRDRHAFSGVRFVRVVRFFWRRECGFCSVPEFRQGAVQHLVGDVGGAGEDRLGILNRGLSNSVKACGCLSGPPVILFLSVNLRCILYRRFLLLLAPSARPTVCALCCGSIGGDQEIARLFNEKGCGQEEIARHMGKKQPWVAKRLCFGRFLSFIPSGNKPACLANLTERRFREYYKTACAAYPGKEDRGPRALVTQPGGLHRRQDGVLSPGDHAVVVLRSRASCTIQLTRASRSASGSLLMRS